MLVHLLNPPLSLLELVERTARRAVRNAHVAADALHAQNEDRRRLAPVDAETARGTAGELTHIPREECLRLLRTRHLGRLAYVPRGQTPDVVPVNYAMDRSGRHILLRSGPGPKLQAAARGAVVAFEVDEIDGRSRTGWSVVVKARASVLARHDGERLAGAPRPWAAGPRDDVICLRVDRVEGRRLS